MATETQPVTSRDQQSGTNAHERSQGATTLRVTESRAKVLGHPVHQMLIVFPLGLLATAVIFDVLYLITDDRTMATTAFWMLVAGIIGGFLAAPFGWLDWVAIPHGTRAKRVGRWHGGGNVVVLLLFIGSWLLWREEPSTPSVGAQVLAILGAGIALVTGWLGGELVDRLGVGVDQGAHANAPNSLSGRPAHEGHGGLS
jgi:uncharacterized membrane protein